MSDIIPLKNWGLFAKKEFLLIAGPCSVETPEQLRRTLLPLSGGVVSCVRGGVWKPRTRPGAFEGLGEQALSWLKASQTYTGLPVATEVASPRHVELALAYGIDVVWIGARSTANPFTVQEIADALAGTDVPVWVKNPVNPDLSLWIGAVERLLRAGLRRIAAIHRGFSPYTRSHLRNPPLWHIPMELKNEFPTLSLICDPSHMTGKRELIAEMSQHALNLGYEGLMIETHFDPENALTDARQQLTPEALLALVKELTPRNPFPNVENCESKLFELRAQIDTLDRQLIEILKKRLSVCEQIGQLKRENNVAIYQPGRWREISVSRPRWADELGLDANWVRQILTLIHAESIRVQERLIG